MLRQTSCWSDKPPLSRWLAGLLLPASTTAPTFPRAPEGSVLLLLLRQVLLSQRQARTPSQLRYWSSFRLCLSNRGATPVEYSVVGGAGNRMPPGCSEPGALFSPGVRG